MIYPSLLQLSSREEYRVQWERHYCQQPILTFDEILVRFQKADFDHAFFESVKSEKDTFSKKRAERLPWIRRALEDPQSKRFAGWDSSKKNYDQSRRVAVVMGNYIVVIAFLPKKLNEARFITAYLADTVGRNGKLSTIDRINSGPLWKPKEIKKPLICQAGSAEAFIGSTITDGELPSV